MCLCNHLSRFTAGEGLEYVEPPPVIISRTISVIPEVDEESEIFPINMAFFLIPMVLMLLFYKASPRSLNSDRDKKTVDTIFDVVVPPTVGAPRCNTPVSLSVSPPSGAVKSQREVTWGKHSLNDPYQNVDY